MKITAIVCAVAVAFSWAMLVGPDAVQAADNQLSIGSAKAIQLKNDDQVQEPQEKQPKSNKNDGKDGDPDDGNAGGGNDDKDLPNDGPAND